MEVGIAFGTRVTPISAAPQTRFVYRTVSAMTHSMIVVVCRVTTRAAATVSWQLDARLGRSLTPVVTVYATGVTPTTFVLEVANQDASVTTRSTIACKHG